MIIKIKKPRAGGTVSPDFFAEGADYPVTAASGFDSFYYKGNSSMDADYDIFEIVAVIRDFWLVDAESYQRKYCTNHGLPLPPGFYVVNWPEHIRSRRFNDHATFHGPFELRKEARVALDWMSRDKDDVSVRSPGISSVPGPFACPMKVKQTGTKWTRPLKAQKLRKTLAGNKYGKRNTRLPITGKSWQ